MTAAEAKKISERKKIEKIEKQIKNVYKKIAEAAESGMIETVVEFADLLQEAAPIIRKDGYIVVLEDDESYWTIHWG